MICFYHSADLDGKCSAAIIKYKFPSCELFGVDYQDNVDPVSIVREGHKDVIIVDFSFKPEVMEELYKEFQPFIWIDHHKTAIEAIDRGIAGRRKIGVGACELTWQHFYPYRTIPYAVKLLSRYDVFDLDQLVIDFQFGMKVPYFELGNSPDNRELWGRLFSENVEIQQDMIDYILKNGGIISRYEDQENIERCKMACYESYLPNFNVRAIIANVCLSSGSRLFNSIYDPDKHDIKITYRRVPGNKWRFTLYSSKEEYDASEIAKFYGGGGHKGAAGFVLDYIPNEIGNECRL